MNAKKQIEWMCIDRRLRKIRERRSELVEIMHPYQEEMDRLFEEATELQKKQYELFNEAE